MNLCASRGRFLFEVRPDLVPARFFNGRRNVLVGPLLHGKTQENSVADLEKTVQIIFEAIDNMTDPIGEMGEALSGFGGKAGDATEKADSLGNAIDTIPAEVELDITLEDNASDGINEIHLGIDGVPDEKEIDFDCDSSAIGEVNDLIDSIPSEHEFDFYFSGDPSR